MQNRPFTKAEGGRLKDEKQPPLHPLRSRFHPSALLLMPLRSDLHRQSALDRLRNDELWIFDGRQYVPSGSVPILAAFPSVARPTDNRNKWPERTNSKGW